MTTLFSTPFNNLVTKRIFKLLQVLEVIFVERDENGELSQRGLELFNNHFVGNKAWFTDESETNKQKFKRDLTFTYPVDPSKTIFCPWHGKIKTPQIRIHFQWPLPQGQKK